MTYSATKQHVFNRGIAPDSFLDQLVAWGKTAPDEIFAPNTVSDIYSSVKNTLGPWEGIEHRRAVMLEVMRVLAGFESSWRWNEGRDTSNPDSDTPEEIEAGAWQVSANSMNFGRELKDLVRERTGTLDPVAFQENMKADHLLAMEYIARLLRRTIRHNGPVRDGHIHMWLRRDAVSEFQELLKQDAADTERDNVVVSAPTRATESDAVRASKIYVCWDGELKGDISDRTGTLRDTVRRDPVWFPEEKPDGAKLIATEIFTEEIEVFHGIWKGQLRIAGITGTIGVNVKFKGRVEYWMTEDTD
jgi:hypothetical protein